MSRYINADTVKVVANDYEMMKLSRIYGVGFDRGVQAMLNIMNEAVQSIDLVRCRECKWFDDRQGCFFSTAKVNPTDFCSYGERK